MVWISVLRTLIISNYSAAGVFVTDSGRNGANKICKYRCFCFSLNKLFTLERNIIISLDMLSMLSAANTKDQVCVCKKELALDLEHLLSSVCGLSVSL